MAAGFSSRRRRKRLAGEILRSLPPPLPPLPKCPDISLLDFFIQAWPVLEPKRELSVSWHLEYICELLEEVSSGRIKKLLINIAPRHLKSRVVSVAWPCWQWLFKPHLRLLCLSYSSFLANDHNDERRSLIKSPWYQELSGGMPLSGSKDRIAEFSNLSKGIMLARGFDGSVTGSGGDGIIVDDPNNPIKSESEAVRESTLKKFQDYSITRKDSPQDTWVVVVQQRVHERDVSGLILKNFSDYTLAILPTEAESRTEIVFPRSNRTLIREPGDLLHPERFGRPELEEAKRTLGSFLFASRHQQRPVPAGGGRIKLSWFRRYTVPPSDWRRIVQSWDTAQKAGALNDPWVCATWGEWEGKFYLLEVFRRRMEFPEGLSTIASLAQKWKPAAILIEDKSSGASCLQQLRYRNFPYSLIGISPTADKTTRMDTETPAIESGRVFLPESADWLPDYEAEIALFPSGSHDDQVDATSQFLAWARTGSRLLAPDFSTL